MRSISAPVNAFSGDRPKRAPMARAVSRWSPVIIFTAMPARRQRATASSASSRGGSPMPNTPSNVKPPCTSASAEFTLVVADGAHRHGEQAQAVLCRVQHDALPIIVPQRTVLAAGAL